MPQDMTDAAARTAAVDACQTALASLLQGQVGGAPALARAAAVGSLLAAAVDRAGVADVGASVLAGAGNAWQDGACTLCVACYLSVCTVPWIVRRWPSGRWRAGRAVRAAATPQQPLPGGCLW